METKKFNKTQDWTVFILRRVDEDGAETDTILGGFYSYEPIGSVMFNEYVGEGNGCDMKDIYAIITFFDHSWMPLYKQYSYYVMTDTGGTVSNRSFKSK